MARSDAKQDRVAFSGVSEDKIRFGSLRQRTKIHRISDSSKRYTSTHRIAVTTLEQPESIVSTEIRSRSVIEAYAQSKIMAFNPLQATFLNPDDIKNIVIKKLKNIL